MLGKDLCATPPMVHWTAHIDASAVPNPGRMSIGAVLLGPQGQLHTLSRDLGCSGCNNEAEALAFIAALQLARSLGVDALQVWTDSSILVEQLTRAGVRPIQRLEPVYAQARQSMAQMAWLGLGWIPRHRNSQADRLARAALQLS